MISRFWSLFLRTNQDKSKFPGLVATIVVVMTLNLIPNMWRAGMANYYSARQQQAIWGKGPILEVPEGERSSGSVMETTGLAYLLKGNLARAEKYLTTAISSPPNYAPASFWLGHTYFTMGDEHRALDVWQRAGFDVITVLEERAAIQLRRGQWETAIRYYSLATRVNPTDGTILSLLGEAYQSWGHAEEASKAYAQAAALQTDLYQAAILEGKSSLVIRNWSAAKEAYQRAKNIAPERAEPYLREGYILYWGEGMAEQATQLFEAAIIRDPRDPEPYLRLIQVYTAEDDEGARDWIRRALLRFPNNVGILNQVALYQVNHQDNLEALNLVQRMLALNPDSTTAWALRGQVLTNLGRLVEARAAYQRAIALAPGNGNYHLQIAKILLSTGDTCGAYEEATLAEKLSPQNKAIVTWYAEIRVQASGECGS